MLNLDPLQGAGKLLAAVRMALLDPPREERGPAQVERDGSSAEAERQLSLLRRQRATFDELVARRVALARQLDSAGLALGSLRLDLIKLRSSGLQSALSDVSSATQ